MKDTHFQERKLKDKHFEVKDTHSEISVCGTGPHRSGKNNMLLYKQYMNNI